MPNTRPLAEVADIIRSKNAGPYRITFDIMFKNKDAFDNVRRSGSLKPETIAAAYRLPINSISSFFEVEMANAIKVTIKRPVAQSTVGDGDTYGCQQHVPMMNISIASQADRTGGSH
ncbi:DUF4387 domain-containing protein [Mesorhizobium sp.]|uniref:DUF4387 domain-containing protein n=1 Tax=Mesorhizobium sp. TaxID=1871066 RepID=UPI000FE651D8|nr:DUF4387 domain-containing protein [Mesorhizobium sp.]RWI88879.1 MAG: DUF4387 domain-containing protein [Mesorhizobium sp.]